MSFRNKMYLHVGNNRIIREKDIIGIFDTDSSTLSSPITKKYLSDAEKSGRVEMAGDDIPKSFIVYRDPRKKETRICFSVLSTAALIGRISEE